MQACGDFYSDEMASEIIQDLNTNKFTELAELLEMRYGAKPEPELQRLIGVRVIAIDLAGLHLLCHYHRWETAEKNDRMFAQHTDETQRSYIIPFITQPHSREELRLVINKMISEAKESYLKGFD